MNPRDWNRLALTAVLLWTPARAEIIEEMVANVNGEVVTRTELLQREREIRKDLYSRYSGVELDRALDEVVPNVLVDLINEKLLYQRAERMGLDFDQVFRSSLDNIKRQNKIETNEELRKLLEKQGTTMEEFRKNLLKYNVPDIMINIEVRQKINVTEEQVQAYYDEHADDFSLPDVFTFREVALLFSRHDREEAVRLAGEVVEAARSGADFTDLVEQYSEASSREQGGLVESHPAPEMSKKILEALESLEPGEVSEPVVMPRAVMVLKLEKKQEAHVDPLEKVHDRIVRALRRARMDDELDQYLHKLWAESRIRIAPKYEAKYATDLYR